VRQDVIRKLRRIRPNVLFFIMISYLNLYRRGAFSLNHS
jgi:hypothetical protein